MQYIIIPLICGSLFAVSAEKTTVIQGWRHLPEKNETGELVCSSPTVQRIKTTRKNPLFIFRVAPIQNCMEGMEIKIAMRTSGHGRIKGGYHGYTKTNQYLGSEYSAPVEIRSDEKKHIVFNMKISELKYGFPFMIRPIICVEKNSDIEFQDVTIGTYIPQKRPELVRPMVHYFENLIVKKNDFELRYMASEKKIYVRKLALPYADRVMEVVKAEFVIKSDGKEWKYPFVFEGGVIENVSFPLPKELNEEFTVSVDYISNKGQVIVSGNGYTWQRAIDLTTGRYLSPHDGTIKNSQFKEWVKEYKLGQSKFTARGFPFEKMDLTKLPKNDLPGFKVPEITGRKLSVLGRGFEFSGSGLPQKIDITQNEPTVGEATEQILSEKMEFVLDGKPFAADQEATFKKIDDAVLIEGNVHEGKMLLKISGRLESDGCIRTNIRFTPDPTKKIKKLSLRIPLKKEQATLYHDISDVSYRRIDRSKQGTILGGFGGHAGGLPNKKIRDDIVWQSTDSERQTENSFQPMVWLGNEDRGLCWFADCDNDWFVGPEYPALEIARENNQTVLYVNFINGEAKDYSHSLSWEIGILPTPVKPMFEHWRATIFPRWMFYQKDFYDRLTNLRKIRIIGAGHPLFNNGMFSIAVKDLEETKKVYAEMADGHLSTNMEYICSDLINMNVPELAKYFSEWGANLPDDKVRSVYYEDSKLYDYGSAVGIAMNRNSGSYLKYRLWEIDRKLGQIKNFSFYEDNMHLRPKFDPEQKAGFIDKKGAIHKNYGIWALREYYKNIAAIYRAHDNDNLSGAHSSGSMLIPAFSYCSFFLDGEQPGRYDYNSDGLDYVDKWKDTDYIRTISMGRQFGINTVMLCQMYFKSPDEQEMIRHTRAFLAIMLPHDIGIYDGTALTNRKSIREWQKIINDMNFLDNPPRFYPYWAKGENKVFEHSSPDLLVTVWKQKKQCLVMLSNLGEENNFRVKLDWKKLDLSENATATDPETGNAAAIKDHTLECHVKRHDFRVFAIKNK